MEITYFNNINHTENGSKIGVDQFLNSVKTGMWKEISDKVNAVKNKKERQDLKAEICPYVTVSGHFQKRRNQGLIKHSGFICMDFDNMENVDDSFNTLKTDPFVYACFRSVSGRGIAAIIKIDSKRHLDAFLGLERYFTNKYHLLVDRSCKDVSRPRYVSYDPDTHVNPESEKFTNYIPKSEIIRAEKLPNVVLGSNDMEHIMQQVRDNGVDLTDSSYDKWYKIGFALAEEFGEGGRGYFHSISENSAKYDPEKADKQFDYCVNGSGEGLKVGFATFLYFAQKAGISIVSDQTKHISTVALMAKNGGRSQGETVDTLKAVDGIEPSESRDIVDKVFKRAELTSANMLSRIQSIEAFLNANYDLKRNDITRFVENAGTEIDTVFSNSVYLRARKELDDKIKIRGSGQVDGF